MKEHIHTQHTYEEEKKLRRKKYKENELKWGGSEEVDGKSKMLSLMDQQEGWYTIGIIGLTDNDNADWWLSTREREREMKRQHPTQ